MINFNFTWEVSGPTCRKEGRKEGKERERENEKITCEQDLER